MIKVRTGKEADVALINFISQSEFVLTSEVAGKFYYNSTHHANRRLKDLCAKGYLKRSRENLNSHYKYSSAGKKMGQLKHRAIATEFYLYFTNQYDVVTFEWGGASLQKRFKIKPDLVFQTRDKIYLVEIGNTKLMSSESKVEIYKNLLEANEQVVLVCVSHFNPKLKGLNYKWVNSNDIDVTDL